MKLLLRGMGLLFIWGSTITILHTLNQMNSFNTPYMNFAIVLLAYALMVPSAIYISLHLTGLRIARTAALSQHMYMPHPLSEKSKRFADDEDDDATATFEELLDSRERQKRR